MHTYCLTILNAFFSKYLYQIFIDFDFDLQSQLTQQPIAYYNNASTPVSNNPTTVATAAGVAVPQQPPQPQPQPPQAQPPQLATPLVVHQQIAPPTVLPAPALDTTVVNGSAHPEEVISATIPAAVMSVPPASSLPQQPALIPTQPVQIAQPPMPIQQVPAPTIVPQAPHPNVIKQEEEEPELNEPEDENEDDQEPGDDHEGVGDEEDKSGQQEILEDIHHHHNETGNLNEHFKTCWVLMFQPHNTETMFTHDESLTKEVTKKASF